MTLPITSGFHQSLLQTVALQGLRLKARRKRLRKLHFLLHRLECSPAQGIRQTLAHHIHRHLHPAIMRAGDMKLLRQAEMTAGTVMTTGIHIHHQNLPRRTKRNQRPFRSY